jgi:lipoate-protein ligase B
MSSTSTTWSAAQRKSASLEVYLLGRVEFEAATFLQERSVYDISGRNDRLGNLLACEHPPVITVGREGSTSDILAEQGELTAKQIQVVWLNRGGGCFVHAPGQLAVYPIVPLDRLGLDVVEYRRRLEEAALDVCRELKIPATRSTESPGIICRTGQVAHVGVAVKSWVAYHGLFLNVCPSMNTMRMVSSNAAGVRVSSLAAQRQRPTSMHKVRESLVRNIASRLEYDQYHLYTGHPLLRRTKNRVHVPA